MELHEVFEKIYDIASKFTEELDADHFAQIMIAENKFAFFVNGVIVCINECECPTDQYFEFPIENLTESPTKLYAAWKKEKTAKERENRLMVRRVQALKKDPAILEYLKLSREIGANSEF